MKPPLSEQIKEIKLFLLDLDGTVYIEDTLIPGALEFIEKLRADGIEFVFLTNNSSKSAHKYEKKLQRLGFKVEEKNVFTSGQATAMHLLSLKKEPSVYLVGTSELADEFESFGIKLVDETFSDPDFAVIGFDRELTYEKLEHLCFLIDSGVEYIATNPDKVCPIKDNRFIPDCGAMCEMIEHATGKLPLFIGKPDRKMVDILCDKFNVSHKTTAMIGDRLYTDIAVGNNAGITTICVLSGESGREDIEKSPDKPDYIIESVNDLNGMVGVTL